ncbi:MAG: FtsH protease activity modulator HflK [Candidatus Omnitrophica bacterium]|nr:FtsH protease activity modulator HflK [Candidatus Omnitrophota bacterium]
MDFQIPDTPEELFRQGKKYIPKVNKGLSSVVVMVIAVGALILSSFYSVGPDEVGVIRRFGKYIKTTQPGLHWKVPFNIEKLNKVKVKRIYKEEFGFKTVRSGVKTQYSSKAYIEESLMLTGDLNVVDVNWIVQFKLEDPVKALFNIRDVDVTVRDISESVMRQVIGDSSVEEVLTTRRIEINQEVQGKMQEILNSYNIGIQIVTVKLQDVNPPDAVKASFNEVNEAKQEKEKIVNQSWEAYNKVIPKARGEAEKTIREAEGYSLKRINQAKGDATKFIATWNAYKEAKDVTLKRMYLETLSDVLPKAGKIYVMGPEGNTILPLLNLTQEGQK